MVNGNITLETHRHNTKSEMQHFCIKELNEGLSPRCIIEKFYTTVWFCIGHFKNLSEISSNGNVFMYIDEDIFLIKPAAIIKNWDYLSFFLSW